MFHVLSGGCNTSHPTPFMINRPQGLPDVHVLLILKEQTQFIIQGETISVPPYHGILFKKNTPHFYQKKDGAYSNHWIHFDCTKEDEDLLDRLLPNNTIFSIKNPELITTYVQQILWEKFYAPEKYSNDHVNTLFHILLEHLHTDFYTEETYSYSPYLSRLQTLRLKILSEPHQRFNIEDICAEIGISVSYFQHTYKHYFGISFQNDLIQIRVEFAKRLLRNTNITIQDVCYRCGYSNETHFYRQFKKHTGITPNEYRKLVDKLITRQT